MLGISVNISTKFCPLVCILFVCSESCFYTFGHIDWVEWRLARGEDGWGWPTTYKSATGDHLFLMQNECSSPFDHQSILMKDHFIKFMGKQIFFEMFCFFFYFSEQLVPFR